MSLLHFFNILFSKVSLVSLRFFYVYIYFLLINASFIFTTFSFVILKTSLVSNQIHNNFVHLRAITCYCLIHFVLKYCLQILDTNPQLFFHLQQQRLIELIRNGKVEEALEFAQEELAPRGEENVNLIK